MSFEIYTPDLSNRHELTHALSVTTTVHYNGIGKFTMILPIDDYNIQAVQNNAIILDKRDFQTFLVTSIQTDTINNQLVVNGYTANAVLNRRVVASPLAAGNLEAGAYALLTANLRELPGVALAEAKGLEEAAEITVQGGQLLDQVIALLAAGELGHRFVWDYRTKTHTFEVYKGEDRTKGVHAVAFSYERGTAQDLVISDDISALKNVFYIQGRTRDDVPVLEVVGDAQGEDRYEKWLTSEPRQDSQETEAVFRARLRGIALEAAADYLRRQSFQVVIDPADYGVHYGLGDVVSCVSTTFGVRFDTRITGVTYSLDINGAQTALTLGEPRINVLEEMRLNG